MLKQQEVEKIIINDSVIKENKPMLMYKTVDKKRTEHSEKTILTDVLTQKVITPLQVKVRLIDPMEHL